MARGSSTRKTVIPGADSTTGLRRASRLWPFAHGP
ncbi:hypothetical protein GA0070613_5348 [Micromonospora inositola]|uniref:Uncharacterized protein n=1 Tax=Micromonospora inositola TaxID=47865 RepID=A0A1C5JTI5_9ACTN|nr:hypothetical protein GA0070613_5348 [Micromonospora inositola]